MAGWPDGAAARRRVPAALVVVAIGVGVGAAIVAGVWLAPIAGRAASALLAALVVAAIGMVRGLPAALPSSIVIFIAYSLFIGERRLPGDFEASRHLPQLTLFLLLALTSGAMASLLRRHRRLIQLQSQRHAIIAEASRRLRCVDALDAGLAAIRPLVPDLDLRVFVRSGHGIEEVLPLAADDAGRAAEAAMHMTMTRASRHRALGIAAFSLSSGRAGTPILVASRRTRRQVPTSLVETLANLLALACGSQRSVSPAAPVVPPAARFEKTGST